MAIPTLYAPLVQLLTSGTKEGRVKWLASAKEDEYFVSLEDTSIFIREIGPSILNMTFTSIMKESPRKPMILIRIVDDDGKTLDDFTVEEGERDFEPLSLLCKDAARVAKKVDERVRKVTDQLGRLLKASV